MMRGGREGKGFVQLFNANQRRKRTSLSVKKVCIIRGKRKEDMKPTLLRYVEEKDVSSARERGDCTSSMERERGKKHRSPVRCRRGRGLPLLGGVL